MIAVVGMHATKIGQPAVARTHSHTLPPHTLPATVVGTALNTLLRCVCVCVCAVDRALYPRTAILINKFLERRQRFHAIKMISYFANIPMPPPPSSH
jgi:hypothetical protein